MIEVGEYVRCKDGEIDYIKAKTSEVYILKTKHSDFLSVPTKNYEKFILKSSQNIIDLIEEGDYVNGIKVLATTRFSENEIGICIYKNSEEMTCIILKKEDIKSIVTKEQFKIAEYKIEKGVE